MPYHHGNLRSTLIDVAFQAARQDGPEAVVLRAATRAAGVSPNAAYRHFSDREQLLLEVSLRCMDQLGQLMVSRMAEVAPSSDPVATAWDRLIATGRAYVEFATTETGQFRTAFAVPAGALVEDADRTDPGIDPFALLNTLLDDVVKVGGLTTEQRAGAEFVAWTAVHGLATLFIDGPLSTLQRDQQDTVTERVLGAVRFGI